MKLKAIMLPVDSSPLYLHGGKLHDNRTTMHIPDGRQIPQHLYLIDIETEIKEGDICVCIKTHKDLLIGDQFPYNGESTIYAENVKKLIAGTYCIDYLPQLSEQSIKLLIDYYNKNGHLPEFVNIETYD